MEDTIQMQRATVDEHIRGENAHDWPVVYGTFVQDENAFYDVVPLQTHFAGFQGVKDFYQAAQQAFPISGSTSGENTTCRGVRFER